MDDLIAKRSAAPLSPAALRAVAAFVGSDMDKTKVYIAYSLTPKGLKDMTYSAHTTNPEYMEFLTNQHVKEVIFERVRKGEL
jgi:hypothetical protein